MTDETAPPRVSLLMPNRNNAAMLDLVLDRLAAHTDYPDVELVVVDDGSTDASREILERWRRSGRFPELRVIELEHGGVVKALNAGLQAATGELVVQLDADASIETPGWLEPMVSFFLSDERIGVVTGKVVFDSGHVQACGINLVGPQGLCDGGAHITEPVGRRTYHQRVVRYREQECSGCDRISEVDAGIGCCMMYRREVALGVGGYDPGFAPVWFDDLDLTVAIRRHGLKVFFFPGVRVIHHVRKRSGHPMAAWQRAILAVWWRVGRVLPTHRRFAIAHALKFDHPSEEHWARLVHHYGYWREKWGFDMLNPDMDAVRERWGETEICWRTNAPMREAGERIVARYEAARP